MQPALKRTELHKSIADLYKQAEQNPFILRAKRVLAQQLMDVDPHGAHIALAMLEALQFEIDSMRNHFRIAAQYEKHHLELTLLNQVTAEWACARGLEAAAIAARCAEQYRDSLDAQRIATQAMMRRANFEQALKYWNRLDQLGGASNPEVIGMDKELNFIINMLVEHGLNEHDTADYISLAFDYLTEHKIRPLRTEYHFGEDGMIIELEVDKPIRECLELTRAVDDKIIDGDYPLSSLIVLGFIPVARKADAA